MENKEEPKVEAPVMHTFNEAQSVSTNTGSSMKIIVFFVVAAILGIGTGFVGAQITKATGKQIISISDIGPSQKGKTFGSNDLATFKDTTEGKLEVGGIEGEGQYHLVRPGGDSQNVYMTSSIVDLSQFVGKKVKVWGQTQKAQTAGWLMDVGKVEIL